MSDALLERTNALHADALARAEGDREVGMSILARSLAEAERQIDRLQDDVDGNIDWAMRERSRRFDAEERLAAAKQALS